MPDGSNIANMPVQRAIDDPEVFPTWSPRMHGSAFESWESGEITHYAVRDSGGLKQLHGKLHELFETAKQMRDRYRRQDDKDQASKVMAALRARGKELAGEISLILDAQRMDEV